MNGTIAVHGNTRVLLHPVLKQAHSMWKSGKIDTSAWCAIFQFIVYDFELPERFRSLIRWDWNNDTIPQIVKMIKGGVSNDITENVRTVVYKPFRYVDDEPVYTKKVTTFDELVNFIRNLPADKVVVELY